MQKQLEILLADEINTNSVMKIGRVNDISDYLMHSKIYVSLIEPDNYPSQSIFEAMYYGNALVCSNTGDSNKFINNNFSFFSLIILN